jgi:hypothetical protein
VLGHASKGLSLRKKLHTNGYFKGPKNAMALALDPDPECLARPSRIPETAAVQSIQEIVVA